MQNITLCMLVWREVRNFAWHRVRLCSTGSNPVKTRDVLQFRIKKRLSIGLRCSFYDVIIGVSFSVLFITSTENSSPLLVSQAGYEPDGAHLQCKVS